MARGRNASLNKRKQVFSFPKKLKELSRKQGKKTKSNCLVKQAFLPSTLTGYIKGTSLPIAANLEKIAKIFW